ncbi:MAG TPA: hypothetical protein VFI11_13165 [Anaerolineales bacterium]|nr:hypothetical protein [Anaerolineales bacterium]
MDIVNVDTTQPGHVREFLDFPFRLYASTPTWVPPLRIEARRELDRKRNPFYLHSDAAFFLARHDGQTLGRLAVLENRNHNAYNNEHTAFFWLFECRDDTQAAAELFEAGFRWARQRGLDTVFGPKGFTAMDGLGLLVRGFEHRPAFGIPYNLPYYEKLLLQQGFEVAGEILSGYLGANIQFPERIHAIAERAMRRRGLRIASYRTRNDLKILALHLGRLYNASLGSSPGNVPLTAEEIQGIADQMVRFADPRLIKVVLQGDEAVGFLFAYPDVSAALQRNRGRLFPFGWLDLLLEMRRTQWININGAGMLASDRGLGGTAILFSEMFKSVRDGGFRHADLVQVGVENLPMQRELRSFGVDFYKMHRMYRRKL